MSHALLKQQVEEEFDLTRESEQAERMLELLRDKLSSRASVGIFHDKISVEKKDIFDCGVIEAGIDEVSGKIWFTFTGKCVESIQWVLQSGPNTHGNDWYFVAKKAKSQMRFHLVFD